MQRYQPFRIALSGIVKNFQFFITILYLFAIAIGMLFNNYKYKAFDINIFDYSSVFDFLMAPFADYRILAFTIITMLLSYGVYLLDTTLQYKHPREYSKSIWHLDRFKGYYLIKVVCSIAFFVFYLFLAAILYGKTTYKETLAQSPVQINFINKQSQSAILIGKTSEVLFVYQKQTIKVIPINTGLLYIEISK